MTAADLHTLTGAYAVHALPEPERAEFERHLAVCSPCAQEVRELAATAHRLGLCVAATPPPEMRDRVFQRITTVRQRPPRLRGASQEDRPGGGRSGGRARALPRWALAACVAVATALGGTSVWQYEAAQNARQQAERSQRQQERVAQVLAAPDARTTSRDGLPGGATGTVVVSRKQDRAVLLTAGLANPPSGKVYQLWFADGGTMRSAGLMAGTGGASDAVLMKGPVNGASAMGITVEPAGGSRRPTTSPLALLKFPA